MAPNSCEGFSSTGQKPLQGMDGEEPVVPLGLSGTYLGSKTGGEMSVEVGHQRAQKGADRALSS